MAWTPGDSAPASTFGAGDVPPDTSWASCGEAPATLWDSCEPPPAPVVESVHPHGGYQGDTVAIVIRGRYFTRDAVPAISGAGVVLENVVVVSDREITADVVIAPMAAVG